MILTPFAFVVGMACFLGLLYFRTLNLIDELFHIIAARTLGVKAIEGDRLPELLKILIGKRPARVVVQIKSPALNRAIWVVAAAPIGWMLGLGCSAAAYYFLTSYQTQLMWLNRLVLVLLLSCLLMLLANLFQDDSDLLQIWRCLRKGRN